MGLGYVTRQCRGLALVWWATILAIALIIAPQVYTCLRVGEDPAARPGKEQDIATMQTITAGSDFITCWYKGSAAASRGGESVAIAARKSKDLQRTSILFGPSTQRPLRSKEIDGFGFGQIATCEAGSIATGCNDDTLKILDQNSLIVTVVAHGLHNISLLSMAPSGKTVVFTTDVADRIKVQLWTLGTTASGMSDDWPRDHGRLFSLLAVDDETVYAAAAGGVYRGRRNGATMAWNQELKFSERCQSAAIDVNLSIPILISASGRGIVEVVGPGNPASKKRVILQDRGIIQRICLSSTGKYAAIVQWTPKQNGAVSIVNCENITEVNTGRLSKAPPLACWWEKDHAMVLLNDGAVFALSSRQTERNTSNRSNL